MRLIFFTLLMFGFTSATLLAQTPTKEEKKKQKQEQKEAKKREKEELEKALELQTKSAVDTGRWILEANTIADKKGKTFQVSSNLNFIAMHGEKAFIQIGNNSGYLGSNGVGGVTVNGTVSRYKVEYDEKKRSYYIEMFVDTPAGTFDIRLSVNPTGDYTSATVEQGSGELKYFGTILPLEKSTVYMGRPLF